MRRTRFISSPLVLAGFALAVVGLTTGCTSSSSLIDASESYYLDGPSTALEKLDSGQAATRDAVLVEMERAVVLQELGEYEESNRVLSQVARSFEEQSYDAAAGGVSLLVNDRAADYRGEPFERVYLHTLAISNHLALYDIDGAALAAEKALDAIGGSGCTACLFPFTRYLAAVAFEHNGRRQQALEVLGEAVAENPTIAFLRSEMERLSLDQEQTGCRDLYVFLLLGRGPAKVENGVSVYPGHAIAWPRYVARPPSAVVQARIEADEQPLKTAVPLTDMEELAATSLSSRLAGLIAKETGKSIVHEIALRHLGDEHGFYAEFLARTLLAMADRADLRHWSTLPASCQVLRVEVPPEVDTVRLVYASDTGETVHSEDLTLPPGWQEGPMFVTRRVP